MYNIKFYRGTRIQTMKIEKGLFLALLFTNCNFGKHAPSLSNISFPEITVSENYYEGYSFLL